MPAQLSKSSWLRGAKSQMLCDFPWRFRNGKPKQKAAVRRAPKLLLNPFKTAFKFYVGFVYYACFNRSKNHLQLMFQMGLHPDGWFFGEISHILAAMKSNLKTWDPIADLLAICRWIRFCSALSIHQIFQLTINVTNWLFSVWWCPWAIFWRMPLIGIMEVFHLIHDFFRVIPMECSISVMYGTPRGRAKTTTSSESLNLMLRFRAMEMGELKFGGLVRCTWRIIPVDVHPWKLTWQWESGNCIDSNSGFPLTCWFSGV